MTLQNDTGNNATYGEIKDGNKIIAKIQTLKFLKMIPSHNVTDEHKRTAIN